MDVVNENESLPDCLSNDTDFFLPDGDFSELLRAKEDEKHRDSDVTTAAAQTPHKSRASSRTNVAAPTSRGSSTTRQSTRLSTAGGTTTRTARKRQISGGTDNTSRSSTPAITHR